MGNQPLILTLLKIPYYATFFLARYLSLLLSVPFLLYPIITQVKFDFARNPCLTSTL